MDIAADYAFALAYQWWLNCDAYFANALRSSHSLDKELVREIGSVYSVNRTIRNRRGFASCILESGQTNGMPLLERAKRLSCALTEWVKKERCLSDPEVRIVTPISAATKISWFVWPCGWTMYDSVASQAVLGSRTTAGGVDRMERFYSTLADRGWDDTLEKVRQHIVECQMDRRLAERALDKHLFLMGLQDEERSEQERRLEAFLLALPQEAQDKARCVGQKIRDHLKAAELGRPR